MSITREQIITWLKFAGEAIAENRDYLTELDSAIGDADHGINMDRGFKKVCGQLASLDGKDIGGIFKEVGMALISSVGGASGPLYGTFFLRAGDTTAGKYDLDPEDIVAMLEAGLAGVIQRGKAKPGDKTMVDTLQIATNALNKAIQSGVGIPEAIKLSVEAAEEGAKSTIPMLAKKGRASYLGERSIGHQDPGATSTYLILKALYDSVNRKA